MTDGDLEKDKSVVSSSQQTAASGQGVSLLGQEIEGKYKILEVLGSGGMGVVYKGEQIFLDRSVAIKFLHPHLLQDDNYLSRFKREAKAASRLNHPNVAVLYDFGSFNSVPYLAMEYVRGKTLKDKLREEGALPFEDVKNIILQTASALSEAHKCGIIHRDLKPENIMICPGPNGKDFVKILDFGIAKLLPQAGDETQTVKTQVGTLIGTPRYSSPEQVLGKILDQRTDIYSLGIIIYEALSGEVPFEAPSMIECFFKHVNEDPKPLSVLKPCLQIAPEIDALVLKCLAKKPEDRFQTADELFQALTNIHSGKTIIEAIPPVMVKGSNKFILWLTFIVIDIAVVVSLVLYFIMKPSTEATSTTNTEFSTTASSTFASNSSPTTIVSPNTEPATQFEQIPLQTIQASSSSNPLSAEEAENILRAAEQDYRNKNYQEAIIKFQQGLSVLPDHKKSFLSYGICLQRVNRFNEALKQFELALALDPTWPPTLFNLACFYAVEGSIDKSFEFLKKSITLDSRIKNWAKNEPDLKSIRNDPRFQKIVGK